MSDLATWLRQQLEDDEREINRHPIDDMPQLYTEDECEGEGFFATGESNYPCNSMLTVNKRFALAEVEAKRRILDRYEDALTRQNDRDYSLIAADVQAEEYQDWVIPLLAQPYAGRPGWREEWRA